MSEDFEYLVVERMKVIWDARGCEDMLQDDLIGVRRLLSAGPRLEHGLYFLHSRMLPPMT